MDPAPDRPVRWRGGAAQLATQDADQLADALQALASRGVEQHVVVQNAGSLLPERRAALEAAGLTLLDSLGANAFFARLDPARLSVAGLVAGAPLTHVGPIDPKWKTHPLLLAGRLPPWALQGEKRRSGGQLRVALLVQFFRGVDLATQGRAAVGRHGGTVRSLIGSVQALSIELPVNKVAALATEDVVQWIEPPLPALVGINDQARTDTGADVVQSDPYGLDGEGIKVLVFDAGQAAANHADLLGRVTLGPSDHEPTSTHSTHVACTIAGDGGLECGVFKGMAPAARILSYGFSPAGGGTFLYTDPGDIESDYTEALNLGAGIANNSIGTNLCGNGYGNPVVFDCDFTGDYGVTDELIDGIVGGSLGRHLPTVWAAGNERNCQRCVNEGGADPQGFHSTAPPGCAKNPIIVGAINSDNESMTDFSSWGPCDDGRLRPDVVAPGCQDSVDFGIQSCAASGGYVILCGTSMSAPVVTGLGALLLQDHRQRHPGQPDLRNATVKALLIHSAEDWGTPGPDYRSGYGSARVQPAVDALRSESFTESTVQPGLSAIYFIDVGPEDDRLQVTLAWDDVPGVPNVEPALVSDLDLRVFSPDGLQSFPWTLNPAQPAAAAVRSQPDRINNVEQVSVDQPAPGTWRVEVSPFQLPLGPQKFSLVATPDLPVCSSRGAVALGTNSVSCAAELTVRVLDCDLNGDPATIESLPLDVTSGTEPEGEAVTLLETGPDSGVFQAAVAVDTAGGPGVLDVVEGDTIDARYVDADDGHGGSNIVLEASAGVDCTAPVLALLRIVDVNPPTAIVELSSDEPTRAAIHFGLSCGQLNRTAEDNVLRLDHTLTLSGIEPQTQYFVVQLDDAAGNSMVGDGGGACHVLVAPDCNGNGKADFQEVTAGTAPDCNRNLVPDECDLQQGASLDCQSDSVPDECQPDCNGNAVADDCDVDSGESADCNANGVPDDCEVVDSSRVFEVTFSPPIELPHIGSFYQDLEIAESFIPSELAVTLHIEHDYTPAVRVKLVHQSSEFVPVQLIESCPDVGADFLDTVLRDSADVAICDGEAPFSGEFRPHEPLAAFSDADAQGIWKLIVSSAPPIGGCGRVRGWTLVFESAASDCNANAVPDDCDLASGVLHDADGDGQPDECEAGGPSIASSVPADGAIDARQPHEPDAPEIRQGWQTVQLDFDGPAESLAAGDFIISQEGGSGPPPAVTAAGPIGKNSVEITLSAPIEPGAWTTLTHNCSGSQVRLGYLPGDVNGDGTAHPTDILALIDALNGLTQPALHASDIDRSALAQPQDILRLIDLLNGGGSYEPWNGRSLP
jgi:subtilisin family serine protease